jgi:hypothetical protein
MRTVASGSTSARGLFHSLVVMGAALGSACGGQSADDSDESGAGAVTANPGGASAFGGAGGANAGGNSGAAAGPITITTPAGCLYTGPAGTPESPLGPADCATPNQLECSGGICRCNAEAPASAIDCEKTQQFQCSEWATLCGCSCDPSAPLDATACTGPNLTFTCYSYDPPVGCYCGNLAPPIL